MIVGEDGAHIKDCNGNCQQLNTKKLLIA